MKRFKLYLAEVWRQIIFAPKLFVLINIFCILTALLTLSHTVLIKNIVDRLTQFGGNQDLQKVIILFVLFALTHILNDVLNGVINYFMDKQNTVVERKLNLTLFEKLKGFSLIEYEKPEFLNDLEKAKNSFSELSTVIIKTQFILSQGVLYLFLLGIYLSRLDSLLALVVIISIIPTIVSFYFDLKLRDKTENLSAPYRRRMNANEEAICERANFKETRHLAAVGFFKEKWHHAATRYKSLKLKENRKLNFINFLLQLFYFLRLIATIYLLYRLGVEKRISSGTVAALIGTVSILYSHLSELFDFHIAGVVQALPYAQNYRRIVEAVPRKSQVKQDLALLNDDQVAKSSPDRPKTPLESISFHDVSFKYPRAEQMSLENITCTFRSGEMVCIVGENGSGKTTLSKILLGLYEPSKGKITLNGCGNEDTAKELKTRSTAVFQNVLHYPLTLKENLTLAEAQSPEELEFVCEEFGLMELVDSLPNGVETVLAKEFGGSDLSGGEWQRLAIARGSVKDAELIVYDEPTSAIDPIFELGILESMIEDKRHPIKVIITHRIGIATKADKILVLKDGRLIEVGKHEELMLKNGEYKRLFDSQSEWYEDEAPEGVVAF